MNELFECAFIVLVAVGIIVPYLALVPLCGWSRCAVAGLRRLNRRGGYGMSADGWCFSGLANVFLFCDFETGWQRMESKVSLPMLATVGVIYFGLSEK